MPNNHHPLLSRVRAALETERRIHLHRCPVRLAMEDDVLVIEGQVETVAAKKLALRLAAGAAGVRGVVDRLQVRPSQLRGDGEVRDSLAAALLASPELRDSTLRVRVKGRLETLHDGGREASGDIELAVTDAVVVFEGSVISLSHKRVAGVLAWWTPGCRDVVNSLAVQPREEDNDGEVIDALGLILEMDPLIRSDQITIDCQDFVVTLSGSVASEAERERAELDAWALFAVDQVVNELSVRPTAGA